MGAILAGSILANSCTDDEQADTTITTTTTTTEVPTVTTLVTDTTVPPIVEAPQPEIFQFDAGESSFSCEVVSNPHLVAEGEHIWKIVDAQAMPDNMPQRWLGTISLNQIRGAVGEDPNLIYPGDQIYTLVDCEFTDGLLTTE